MVKHLILPQQSPKEISSPETSQTSEVSSALIVAPTPQQAPPSDEGPKPRWSRNKLARLIVIICSEDLKEKFISRDRKLDRQEMDAKGRNSFWEECCMVFNSAKHFDIDMVAGVPKFKVLSAAPTGYIADADKLKYEFGQLRASLTKALTNFQKSGMGDDYVGDDVGDDDPEVGEDDHHRVHSSEFKDFCQGDEILEFAEFMLRKTGLLDSATCNMPAGTDFNSSSSRKVGLLSARPKAKGKTSSAKKRKEMASFMKSMCKHMPPLKLHKSAAQMAAEKANCIRQIVKSYEGLSKILKRAEAEMQTAEDKLDAYTTSDASEDLLQAGKDDLKEKRRMVVVITARRANLMDDWEKAEDGEEEPDDEADELDEEEEEFEEDADLDEY
jgi:hypothetical protein